MRETLASCPLRSFSTAALVGGGDRTSTSKRPFRFHASWMLHGDFRGLLEREWKWEGNLSQTLKSFSEKLQAWNKDTFGNILRMKKRNQLRLEGVQIILKRRVTEAMLKLERKLKEERSLILLQEEFLWLQKSRNDWLRYGDGC